MKFIWEDSDIGNPPGRLAIHGADHLHDEIVMVNESGLTSLRDGHGWCHSYTVSGIAEYLTAAGYEPVMDMVTAHSAVKGRGTNHGG